MDEITAAYEAAIEAITNLSHACDENEDTFWTLCKTMQVRVAVERAEYLNTRTSDSL